MKYSRSLTLLTALVCFVSSLASADIYEIDDDKSYIHVLTERGGFFSVLSHRHVVELRPLVGNIQLQEDGTASAGFQLLVNEFRVDHPDATARYPAIWQEPVSESTAAGTRKNMLGKRQLQANVFPAIDIAIDIDNINTPLFNTQVKFIGEDLRFEIPGEVMVNGEQLTAVANFELTHKQLGLKRFKAAGGSVAVGKKLAFKVYIEAQKVTDDRIDERDIENSSNPDQASTLSSQPM